MLYRIVSACFKEIDETDNITFIVAGNESQDTRTGHITIAAKNGTTVAKLCRLNGISKSTTLRVGKVIRVR